jgi:RNA polymerase sigma-70 factor (ECF subfamily)
MTQSDRRSSTADKGERDAALVKATLEGDQGAFNELVEAYHRLAIGTAYRLLGNSDDAAEIAQDAFLRAYRSLGKLKEPAKFGPWLLRTVSNLSLNARRSKRRATIVAIDEQRGTDGTTDGSGEPVVSSIGPEKRAEGHELQEAIDAALEELPEKQRLALVLFTMEGWAQKDIAQLLDCSLETVKWSVFQARKRLREKLKDMMTD